MKPSIEQFLAEEYQCTNIDQDFLKCWGLVVLGAGESTENYPYHGLYFEFQELLDFLREIQNEDQSYIEGPSFVDDSAQEPMSFDVYSGELHVRFISDDFACSPEVMLKEMERVVDAYHSRYPD